jgi:type IX secretion system PorP/SprF family membrane protein
MKKILSITVSLFTLLIVYSQDFHLSQYWASPLNLNPALSGVMEDNIRMSASYRNQWFQYSTYATYTASVDANLFRKKLKGNFLGLGLGFYQDIEGEGDFQNTGVSANLAYNQKFGGRNATHYIGLGFQSAYVSKQINLQNLVYGSLFEFNDNSDPIDFTNYNRKSFLDFGAGFNYFVNIQDKHSIGGGLAVTHIANPNISFGSNNEDILYRKYSANASARLELNNKIISIIPLILYQKQGPHSELNMGSYVRFLLNDMKNAAIYAGAQYRIASYENGGFGSDAFILGVRGEISSVDIGFSYDVTTSNLRNTSTFTGGPELYVIYTIATSKSRYREMINCPKF